MSNKKKRDKSSWEERRRARWLQVPVSELLPLRGRGLKALVDSQVDGKFQGINFTDNAAVRHWVRAVLWGDV